jgi:hypothetical protein
MNFVKSAAKQAVQLTGYKVIKAPTGNALYDRILPGAEYAPWSADRDFLETYEAIRANTLVDIYRCWEL